MRKNSVIDPINILVTLTCSTLENVVVEETLGFSAHVLSCTFLFSYFYFYLIFIFDFLSDSFDRQHGIDQTIHM